MTITIAEITIAAADFELGNLIADDPDRYVELERLVPMQQTLLPFIWISGSSKDTVEATLDDLSEIRSVTELTELGDRTLYRLEWFEGIDDFIETLIETDGTILEGFGSSEQWDFRIRFPDQASFGAFTRRCSENGIDVTLGAVYSLDTTEQARRLLTDSQRETLLTAKEMGFFEVPREVTLSDLAAHFDISDQAVSQRIRRGTGNLITQLLSETDHRPPVPRKRRDGGGDR